MKKFYKLFIKITFIIVLLPVLVVAQDTTPPTLVSLEITPVEVNGGDSFSVVMQITDDNSGFSNGFITITNPENDIRFISYSSEWEVVDNDYYKASFTISQYDVSGNWYISLVQLEDNEENQSSLNQVDLETMQINTSFTVSNTTPDTTPPVLNNLNVNPKEALAKEEVTISFNVSDDLSGFDNGYIKIGDPNEVVVTSLYSEGWIDKGNGNYEASFTIGQYEESGTWYVYEMKLADIMGNTNYLLKGDLTTFNVSGTTVDNTGPTAAVTITPGSATTGDNVTIVLNISDDVSGFDYGNLTLKYPDGIKNDMFHSPDDWFKTGDNVYSLFFPVDQYTQPGTYTVSNVSLYDKAGNLNSLVDQGTFEVTGTTSDVTPPTLDNFTLSSNTVQPGDNLEITIDISDDISGFREGEFSLRSPSGQSKYYYSSEYNWIMITENQYKVIIPINEYEEEGTWTFTTMDMIDHADNRGSQTISQTVELTGTTPDTNPPVLSSLTIDPDTVGQEGILTINLDLSDDLSGISDFFITLSGPANQSIELSSFNDFSLANGLYTSEIRLSEFQEPGLWYANYLFASDKVENIITLDEKDLKAEFFVDGKFNDINPPSFESLTLSANTINPGDIITFTCSASDDLSGIASLDLKAMTFDGDEFHITDGWILIDQNTYRVSYEIPAYLKAGDYYLTELKIVDNAGNQMIKSHLGYFMVNTHANEDNTPPEVVSISASAASVTPGNPVTITAEITDDLSGVNTDNLFMVFTNTVTGNHLLFHDFVETGTNTNVYEATFNNTSSAPTGAYYLESASIMDMAENETDRLPSKKYFEITGSSTPDNSVPKLTGLSVNKAQVNAGESVTYSLTFTDETEVLGFEAAISNTSNFGNLAINVDDFSTVSSSGNHIISFTTTIPANASNGKYRLDFITVIDQLINMKTFKYGIDYSTNSEFEVTGGSDIKNNHAPVLTKVIKYQESTAFVPFSLDLNEYFADPDDGDVISYSISLEDGSAAPSWLSVDNSTGSLAGSSTNNDIGSYSIKITASDPGGLKTDEVAYLTITINQKPELITSIPDQTAEEGTAFELQIPENTFNDPDPDDILTFNCSLEDNVALPTWLSFDSNINILQGTPEFSSAGKLVVVISATDKASQVITDTFSITIANVNQLPLVSSPIPDQSIAVDELYHYVVPAGSLTDPDPDDQLTYSASLQDGSALPAWLEFDAATQTFSGTPKENDIDILSVKVTASDQHGEQVSDIFNLEIKISTGLEERNSMISLYPNPVIDYLSIRNLDISHHMVELRLINITGHIVKKQTFSSSAEIKMNLTNQRSGTYILQVIAGEHKISERKIIKY